MLHALRKAPGSYFRILWQISDALLAIFQCFNFQGPYVWSVSTSYVFPGKNNYIIVRLKISWKTRQFPKENMSGVCLCKIHHNNPKMLNVVLQHFYNFLGDYLCLKSKESYYYSCQHPKM